MLKYGYDVYKSYEYVVISMGRKLIDAPTSFSYNIKQESGAAIWLPLIFIYPAFVAAI